MCVQPCSIADLYGMGSYSKASTIGSTSGLKDLRLSVPFLVAAVDNHEELLKEEVSCWVARK